MNESNGQPNLAVANRQLGLWAKELMWVEFPI